MFLGKVVIVLKTNVILEFLFIYPHLQLQPQYNQEFILDFMQDIHNLEFKQQSILLVIYLVGILKINQDCLQIAPLEQYLVKGNLVNIQIDLDNLLALVNFLAAKDNPQVNFQIDLDNPLALANFLAAKGNIQIGLDNILANLDLDKQ